jgi:serine/threonine-protein kinase RsbW
MVGWLCSAQRATPFALLPAGFGCPQSELYVHDASPGSDLRILRRPRQAGNRDGARRRQPSWGTLMTTGSASGSGQRPMRSSGLPSRVAVPAAPVIRVLPGIPESATAARQLMRQLLGDGHPVADTAMLLISELVTNSVMHSRSRRPGGTVTVAVCAGPASVLIQVRDDGGPSEPRLPGARGGLGAEAGAESDEHGYGLLLVDALAETWGTSATTDGRVTWCRLAVDRLDEDTRR